jgi:predicted Zn-dependent protease
MSRLEQLQTFLDESPNDPFLIYAMAQEYLKEEQWEKALEHFDMLAKDHTEYMGTYYHLGKLQERMKRPDEARQAYKDGIEIATKTGNRHALSELERALADMGG